MPDYGSRDIQPRSPMRENRTLGSVPGAAGDCWLYGDAEINFLDR
jgi:hypothetical protein